MDDTCAVCAETLEWVAYGPCGHREVCSTCVSRLRFICNNLECCICKTESKTVFYTKSLGDYTAKITDFSIFPPHPKEGKNGAYYYHEDTNAFFDDAEHYKTIKSMCKLSCNICEEDNEGNMTKLKTVDQLKSHLFHRHKKIMCVLCLQGRKIFVSEQKLYTRPQLDRHIVAGDSEVDGNEMERGGFCGHPMCEFCNKRYYGESELHSHMSTQHYTCHICLRQRPGEYEYYRNYDDMEVHFKMSHFLCENEGCIEKKFVVFVSESELKRHDALEHGGSMSRAMRNAALKLPTSFRYERSSVQGSSRGRGRGRRDLDDVQGNLGETSMFGDMNREPVFRGQSEGRDIDEIVAEPPVLVPPPIELSSSFPPLPIASTDSQEVSSRYRQATVSRFRNVALEQSSFPPLPGASPSSSSNVPAVTRTSRNVLLAQSSFRPIAKTAVNKRQKPKKESGSNTRAPLHQKENEPTINVSNSAISRLASSHTSTEASLASGHGLVSSLPSTSPSSSQPKAAGTYVGSVQVPRAEAGPSASCSRDNRRSISNPAQKSLDSSISNFPPISAPKVHEALPNTEPTEEDVYAANSSLCEKIRCALEFDENKYSTFKGLLEEYRKGVIGAEEYLSYVQQFDLLHLVLDLARLCPDPQKQRDLLDKYNASVRSNSTQEVDLSISIISPNESSKSKKGKGKSVKGVNTTSNASSSAGGGVKQQKKTSNFHGLKLVLSASSGSSSGTTSNSLASHNSISISNHVEGRGSLDSPLLDFPPISAPKVKESPPKSEPKEEDVYTANGSLCDKIRSALEFDENKYSAFKGLSEEYRQGVIGAGEYFSYVQQFDLSHLVLDLARLCPDPQKQRVFLDKYNSSMQSDSTREDGLSISTISSNAGGMSKKGKGGAKNASKAGSSAGVGGLKQQKKTSSFHGLQLVLSASSGSSGTTSTSLASRKSVSTPNHVERRGSLDSSSLAFPPISVPKKNLPASSESKMEDNVQTTNNTLWENIRSALEFDEDKYTSFKGLSVEYVEGVIGAGEYLFYVQQFGLSHLVLELVRLCPDPRKQRELLDTHNASVLSNNTRENGLNISATSSKGSSSSNKGKTKKTTKLHKQYLGNGYEQQSEHKDVWLNGGGQKLVSLAQI